MAIYYLMGKSASGKDTIFKRLMQEPLGLRNVTMYTTRPKREGETEGVEYHFVTAEDLKRLNEEGKVIECRTYETVAGPWSYFTVDDGQFAGEGDILMIGTLESYRKMRDYFGPDALVPLYIHLEDGERLTRALNREKKQARPNYEEMCRRFLADAVDFSDEKQAECGITPDLVIENDNTEETVRICKEKIQG